MGSIGAETSDAGGVAAEGLVDWDTEYGLLITATGWTYEYIDEYVTLPRLNALKKYWLDRPPVHITAALFAGIKPVSKPNAPRKIANAWQGAEVLNDDQFADLARGRPGVVMQNRILPK